MRILLSGLLLFAVHFVFAADSLGYSANLNDEDTDNAIIFPSSGGAATDTRPRIILPRDSLESNYLIVPMPESAITQNATRGRIKTKPIQPIVK